MFEHGGSLSSIKGFIDFLEGTLEGIDVSHDRKTVPSLSLGLCEILGDSLSESERQAVEAARTYLATGQSAEADKWIMDLGDRVGGWYPPDVTARLIAKERLIWCALVRVSEFDGLTVDFVLGVAEDAGITFAQMLPVAKAIFSPVLGISRWPGDPDPS